MRTLVVIRLVEMASVILLLAARVITHKATGLVLRDVARALGCLSRDLMIR